MANEWTPFPERDEPQQTPPPAATQSPREDTQIIPPAYSPSQTVVQDPPRRRAGSLTAAVLAGALVIGGAAGVGGAAAYDAFKGSDSSQTSTNDVNATNRTTVNSTPADGTVESVAAKVLPSVVQINVTSSGESGTGSGIVLSKDGLILTNNHVASVAGNNGSMRVDFDDGTSAKATLVGADPVTDLAVIKAQGKDDLTPAEIGKSSDLKVGENVVAVGSPYGLGATVTSGIVSALNRAVSVQTSEQDGQGQSQQQNPFGLGQQQQGSADQTTTYPAIQTDAAINPGNSGGPLVNSAGQVIGINSSIRTASSSSSEEAGSIGLGFAIPIDEVLPIVNQLKNGDTATHARLGITVGNSTSNDQAGAVVRQVESGSAGADAGLKSGDVVTKLDDVTIDGADSLVATVRGHRPGDEVTLTVIRDGKTDTVKATLGTDEGKTGS